MRRLVVLAFLLLPVMAHAQCYGLAAYTGLGGRFVGGITPNAADLNCLQIALLRFMQENFVQRSGGTITGALGTIPGGAPRPTGDNAATLDFLGNRVNILKQVLKTSTNNPTAFIQLSNSSPMPLQKYGLYPQIGALSVASYGLSGGTASLDTAIFSLNLYGNKPYQAQDVDIQATVNQYGHDSSWLIDGWTRDLSGEPPRAFSQVGLEEDFEGNGSDAATAAYDPLHTYRLGLAIIPTTHTWDVWRPRTTYSSPGPNAVGSVIEMNNQSGAPSIYKATMGGKSCNEQPSFPNEGSVADCGVIWTYEEQAGYEMGRGIWLDGLHTSTSFGSGFASNARFEDAAIDISQALLARHTSAGIRLAVSMPIDFSGNGTQGGQNNHTLMYSGADNALTYTVKGSVAVSVSDTGLASFPGQIQAPLATPKSSSSPCVAGTRIADADYEYVCVATNMWKRAALSSF